MSAPGRPRYLRRDRRLSTSRADGSRRQCERHRPAWLELDTRRTVREARQERWGQCRTGEVLVDGDDEILAGQQACNLVVAVSRDDTPRAQRIGRWQLRATYPCWTQRATTVVRFRMFCGRRDRAPDRRAGAGEHELEIADGIGSDSDRAVADVAAVDGRALEPPAPRKPLQVQVVASRLGVCGHRRRPPPSEHVCRRQTRSRPSTTGRLEPASFANRTPRSRRRPVRLQAFPLPGAPRGHRRRRRSSTASPLPGRLDLRL